MSTVHINANTEDVANVVIMPGDPLRAKYIAENFLVNFKLINTVRNMFGYTGYYKNKKVTVMASGMGNPSMGIYSYELYKNYNVDTILRIGTCGSYKKEIKVFDLILVENSYSNSSYALNLCDYIHNDISSNKEFNELIYNTAKNKGINIIKGNIHNTDTFYNNGEEREYLTVNFNCLGVEMETYALFSNAKYLNKRASAILTVSDNLVDKTEISSEERERSTNKMIELALESILSI